MVHEHFPFGAEFGTLKTLKNAKLETAELHDDKCRVGTIVRSLLL